MKDQIKAQEIEFIYEEAITLLKTLINIPSISKQEDKTAKTIYQWLTSFGAETHYVKNNVWSQNKYFDDAKPTILLLSHHDTVQPSTNYSRDPYCPEVIDGKLYGLGSNDAGGPLVTLLGIFKYFYAKDNLPFNLVICAAAEEEISGKNGVELALKHLPKIDFSFVGEPTGMQVAVSEKGLMVCDCVAKGKAGHAARDEGVNAINIAMKDIQWIEQYQFPKTSATLGPVKMTVATINGGVKHNVVPEHCEFIVDVRSTDAYSNAEILKIMQDNMRSTVTARSFRLQPSQVSLSHPIIKILSNCGIETFGSSTMSDQALLNCPSVKFSPGESARSHTADEYIYLSEIKSAFEFFLPFFETLSTITELTLQDSKELA